MTQKFHFVKEIIIEFNLINMKDFLIFIYSNSHFIKATKKRWTVFSRWIPIFPPGFPEKFQLTNICIFHVFII